MADADVIAYSIASFICALFVLEFGADKFVDHTAIVAARTGIPQTIIALLTAGAEWEELAVVVISIARHRSSLAVGNIVGSTISNILGAFSLGLLFHKKSDAVVFDKSSKLYSVLLLLLTVLVAGLVAFGHHIQWRVVGGVTIGLFVVYLTSIGWAISKGRINAPELSDSDDSDGSTTDGARRSPSTEATGISIDQDASGTLGRAGEPSPPHILEVAHQQPSLPEETEYVERESSVQQHHDTTSTSESNRVDSTNMSASNLTKHSLVYHVALLLVGFFALVLSAYVLSHAASTLVNEFDISDVLFGVIILSIVTTIPEKFTAVVSGSRGHMGITVANTVGSNIFLLTLCMGILWTTTDGALNDGSVNLAEIGVMVGSSLWMTLTIWFGQKWVRSVGAAMMVAYVAFIVLEFAVIRQV